MRGSTRWTAGLATLASLAGGACGGNDGPPPLRQMSNSYSYTITADDVPPHARQDIHYTIQVLDRATRQPIENGTGQLFASNINGAKTWDGMAYGPEIGTYHAKLNFVVAGIDPGWAVAIRFQRDSLHPLERIDWSQQVYDERPETSPPPPPAPSKP